MCRINDVRHIAVQSQYIFHVLPHFNSKTTGLMFTKFLHNVELLVLLLMCAYTICCYTPFLNAKATSEGGQF